MSQTLKNLFAFLVLFGIAILGYTLFVQKDSNQLFMKVDEQVSNQLLVQASSFVQKRRQVESIIIDTSVLLDSRFTNLNTYTNDVANQAVGKVSLFESAEKLISN